MSGEAIPSANQTKLRFFTLEGHHGVFTHNTSKLESWNKQTLPYVKTWEPSIWRKMQKVFYDCAGRLSYIISAHQWAHRYCLLFLEMCTCCLCQAAAQQSWCFMRETEYSVHLVFWHSRGHPHPHSQASWKTTLVVAQCSVSIEGLPKAQSCKAALKTES